MRPITLTVTPDQVRRSYASKYFYPETRSHVQFCPLEAAIAEKLHIPIDRVVAIPSGISVEDRRSHTHRRYYSVPDDVLRFMAAFDEGTLDWSTMAPVAFILPREQ